MAKKVLSIRVEEKTTLIVHMDYGTAAPMVYGCMRVTTPQGAIEDGVIKDAFAISRRIKKACEEKMIKTKDAIFTIASSKIANRQVTIPAVPKQKIQDVVEAKAHDYFPVDVNNYTFAYTSHGEERNTDEGNLLDLLVFAAPNSLIESYYTLADALGFNVVSLDCDGNSVFQIMKRQSPTGVAMSIQINRLNTLINIMAGDKLLLQRVIPYGISSVTDYMLSDGSFHVESFDDAFDLITSHQVLLQSFDYDESNTSVSYKKRIDVTDSLSSLLSNITRVIEYYNTRDKEHPITEIICSGAGASAVGIHELLNTELGIHTSTPKDLQGVKFAKKIVLNRSILQYVGCFGATFEPVGFIPKDMILKSKSKSSTFSMLVVFGAAVVLAIGLAVLSILQVVSVNNTKTELESKIASLKPIEDRYNQLVDIEDQYAIYESVENTVETANNDLHTIIDEIAEKCPKNFLINAITTTEAGVTINATTKDKLSGIAALKMKLDTIEKIDGVAIKTITATENEQTKEREYAYSISCSYTKNLYTEDNAASASNQSTQTTETNN